MFWQTKKNTMLRFAIILLQFCTTQIWHSKLCAPLRTVLRCCFTFGKYHHRDFSMQDWTHLLCKNTKYAICKVNVEKIGVGASLSTYKCHLEYDKQNELPKRVILKHVDQTGPFMYQLLSMIQSSAVRECGFYRLLMQYPREQLTTVQAQEFALDVPTIYHVEFNWWTHDYLIVMEDVSLRQGYEFFTTQQGASKEVYQIVTSAIAKFQMHWLQNEACQVLIKKHMSWMDAFTPTFIDAMVGGMWRDTLPKVQSWVTPDVETKATKYLIPNFVRYRVQDGKRFLTLSHGDYRLDNMAIDVANKRIVVYDWQACGVRNGIFDMSTFLSSHLSTEDLQAGTYELLMNTYYEHVKSNFTSQDDYYAVARFTFGILPIALIVLNTAKRKEQNEADKKHNTLMDTAAKRVIQFCTYTKCLDQVQATLHL